MNNNVKFPWGGRGSIWWNLKSILLKSQVKEVLLENAGSAWLDGLVKVMAGSASALAFVPSVLCPRSAEKGAALPTGTGRPVGGADPGSGLRGREEGGAGCTRLIQPLREKL